MCRSPVRALLVLLALLTLPVLLILVLILLLILLLVLPVLLVLLALLALPCHEDPLQRLRQPQKMPVAAVTIQLAVVAPSHHPVHHLLRETADAAMYQLSLLLVYSLQFSR